MGELARFTLIRDVQRREIPNDAVVDLLQPGVEEPDLFKELKVATTGEAVAEACAKFLNAGSFIDPGDIEGHPLGRLSAWLREREDRATLRDLVEQSPLNDLNESLVFAMQLSGPTPDNLLTRLAESFVVAMLQEDADPSLGPALHRLILVASLAVQILAALNDTASEIDSPPDDTDSDMQDSDAGLEREANVETRAGLGHRRRTLRPLPVDDHDRVDQRDLVHAALHDRVVLVPNWLTRHPKAKGKSKVEAAVKPEHQEQKVKRRSNLAREPAMSDFYVIEDEWAHYEAAEIAHIENVLPNESKRRTHVRFAENEMTTTTEEETAEVTEKDTQQTDNTEFTLATQEAAKVAFGLDLSVDTQGQYGATALQTHLAAELDGSLESAEQTAYKVSRQIVAQAVSSVSSTTRNERTTRSLTRITERNDHTLSNRDAQSPIVGIYRWVDQVRRLRVMRYPNRYLLEFLIPEPAAWWRWRAQRMASTAVTVPPAIPFTKDGKAITTTNPELSADDMIATTAITATPVAPSAGDHSPAAGTSGVPQPCQAKADELAALNAERIALFAEWDSVQGPGEKADLNRAIHALDAQILVAQSDLEACVQANGSPPSGPRPPDPPGPGSGPGSTPGSHARPPYLAYSARYGAVGIEPPPGAMVLSAIIQRWPGLTQQNNVSGPAQPLNDSHPLEWNNNTTITVPPGWQATSWEASVLAWRRGGLKATDYMGIWVTVGAGPSLEATSAGGLRSRVTGGRVGPISSGSVPVAVLLNQAHGYSVTVELTCEPTAAALVRWRQRTYEAIRQAYEMKTLEYREAVNAAATRKGVDITGLSPARARQVERDELKKLTISLLQGRTPAAPARAWSSDDNEEPDLNLDTAPRDELMFLEQALEWENMRHVHYPYFWADRGQWEDLAGIDSADPTFAAFLRAGSTRVVVPARPSYERQVCFYTRTLIPWGGLGTPGTDEPGYLSVAEEVAALDRAPTDGTQVGPSWEIRLPTQLTCLADDGLPTNASVRIPPPPASDTASGTG